MCSKRVFSRKNVRHVDICKEDGGGENYADKEITKLNFCLIKVDFHLVQNGTRATVLLLKFNSFLLGYA